MWNVGCCVVCVVYENDWAVALVGEASFSVVFYASRR